jgi:hypothetical protein
MPHRFAAVRVFFAAAVLFLTLSYAVPLQAVPIAAFSMRKWDVKDLVLCSNTNYADWQAYQVVRVTASFTGPVNLTVNGFWHSRGGTAGSPCVTGKHAFIVRFTPPETGTYFYSISNNQSDPGLTVTSGEAGAVTVTAPGLSAAGKTPRGFLRRSQAAGSPSAHYAWDDNNTFQYVWGQTYYQIVNAVAGGLTSTWQTAVNNSTSNTSTTYNMNKIRLLVAPWNANGGADTQPYKRLTDGSLNRDQLNTDHFRHLDTLVKYLNDRNIIAELILLRDGTENPLLGTTTQDCRLLRYAVSRYAAYPSVVWSLTNEWEIAKNDQNYWNGLGNAIRGVSQSVCTGTDFSTALDPYINIGGKTRVLTIHPAHIEPGTGSPGTLQFCFEFSQAGWPSAASLQAHKRNADNNSGQPPFEGDRRAYDSIACNKIGPTPCALPFPPLPATNDEYGYINVAAQTQTEHRNAIWGLAVGGGYGTAGDLRGNPPVIQTTQWNPALEYDDIKRLINFFTSPNKGIEFWKMQPQTACQANTRVHTLAQVGQQYVTYTATGATFSVTNFQPGNYRRLWYNPRTSNPNSTTISWSDEPCVNIATNSFTPPSGSAGDWVLLLKKTATCQ